MADIRAGAATRSTIQSSGTDGSATLPRVFVFDPYARPCIVRNATGNGRHIIVKLNATDDTDFGGGDDDGLGYFRINDGWAVNVSMKSDLCIARVSIITTNASDDLDLVSVVGWLP